MNRDDIIRLAEQAGAHEGGAANWVNGNRWEQFAFLVAAAEREECAKVCDGWDFVPGGHEFTPQQLVKNMTETIAHNIRARGVP